MSLNNTIVVISDSIRIYVSELPHTYEWIVTQQPPFEPDGVKECRCVYCGAYYDEEMIPKLVISVQEGSA